MTIHKNPRAPKRSRDEWQQIIDQSNMLAISAESFCKQQNICYATFSKWRSLLKNERRQTDEASPFVELTPPVFTSPPENKNDWLVELNIGEHLVLRLKAS